MKLDADRLHHLQAIHRDRKAAVRAASDDRLDQRDKVLGLERERAQLRMSFRELEARDAFDALDQRIKAAREKLTAMADREAELAEASSVAGQTFVRALEFAQAEGLDLPADLMPRDHGAPALPTYGSE